MIFYIRRFQFRSGPETREFTACNQHKEELDRGPYSFLEIREEPVREEEADDNICDWCREE